MLAKTIPKQAERNKILKSRAPYSNLFLTDEIWRWGFGLTTASSTSAWGKHLDEMPTLAWVLVNFVRTSRRYFSGEEFT
jgi:hypothetical protein